MTVVLGKGRLVKSGGLVGVDGGCKQGWKMERNGSAMGKNRFELGMGRDRRHRPWPAP